MKGVIRITTSINICIGICIRVRININIVVRLCTTVPCLCLCLCPFSANAYGTYGAHNACVAIGAICRCMGMCMGIGGGISTEVQMLI